LRYKNGVKEPCVEEVGDVFRRYCSNWSAGIVDGGDEDQRCENEVMWAGTFEGVLWGLQVAGQTFNGASRCLGLELLLIISP
jgi:hypothetical protein